MNKPGGISKIIPPSLKPIKEIDELKSELQKTSLLLNVERENNIALENYTRRENLKFMNLPEDRGEDCKGMIINLIQNDLKIDVTNIRFHAVHSFLFIFAPNYLSQTFYPILAFHTFLLYTCI